MKNWLKFSLKFFLILIGVLIMSCQTKNIEFEILNVSLNDILGGSSIYLNDLCENGDEDENVRTIGKLHSDTDYYVSHLKNTHKLNEAVIVEFNLYCKLDSFINQWVLLEKWFAKDALINNDTFGIELIVEFNGDIYRNADCLSVQPYAFSNFSELVLSNNEFKKVECPYYTSYKIPRLRSTVNGILWSKYYNKTMTIEDLDIELHVDQL